MRRPPLIVVFVAIFVIALGETAGAAMSRLRPQLVTYARARIAAHPQVHGLAGAAEYDAEVVARTVYVTEAGLSFFHTHAQGLGPVVLFAGTVVATTVRWRRARGALYLLLSVGGLFPIGYLVYSLATLQLGRDAGVELAERYVLTPLGIAAILALIGLAVLIVAGRGRSHAA